MLVLVLVLAVKLVAAMAIVLVGAGDRAGAAVGTGAGVGVRAASGRPSNSQQRKTQHVSDTFANASPDILGACPPSDYTSFIHMLNNI